MSQRDDAAAVRRATAVRRMRWAGIAFVPIQLGIAYRPPPDVDLPLSSAVVIALVAGWLVLLNLTSLVASRRGGRRSSRLTAWLGLIGDIALVVGLAALFAYDPGATLWPLLVMTVVEGAFIKQTRGAVAAALLGTLGILWVDASLFEVSSRELLTRTTYHLAILGAVAVSAGYLAQALESARRTAERQAQRLAELVDREAAVADRLRQVDARRDEVFHLLAHELRKPLTVLSGTAALLRDGWTRIDAEQRQDLLDRLHSRSVQMARLVTDLEEVSAADQGSLTVERRPVDLRGIVAEVVDEEVGRSPRHRAVVDLDDGPLEVLGDAGRLTQVTRELVTNAVKYAPDGGAISVQVQARSDVVTLRVRDEGPGIPSDLRERVFDKFARLPAASGAPGTGLGLYLIRMLVEAMDGRILIEDGVGPGAVFRVELPAAAAVAPQHVPAGV